MVSPPDVVVTATRRRSDGGPSARALLISVLGQWVGVDSDEPVYTTTLVAALEALGVEARAARQAVNRTAADGWIEGEQVGRYARWRISPAGRRLLRSAWSRMGRSLFAAEPWDGRFLLLVVNGAGPDRRARDRLAAGLDFEGFGTLTGGVWLAADQRARQGAEIVLDEVGVADQAVFLAAEALDGAQTPAEVVARAWDLTTAEEAHARFVAEFADVEPSDDRDAFALRTRLSHEWRHVLSVDPMLPAELLPEDWIGTRSRELFADRFQRWTDAATRYYAGLVDAPVAPSPGAQAG